MNKSVIVKDDNYLDTFSQFSETQDLTHQRRDDIGKLMVPNSLDKLVTLEEENRRLRQEVEELQATWSLLQK